MNEAIEHLEWNNSYYLRERKKAINNIKYWTDEWMKLDKKLLDINNALTLLRKEVKDNA